AAFGLFRYGTAAGGVPPTPVKAEWLNMVQEELANFILTYLPELDAYDNTQLLKAIQAFGALYPLKATTLAGYNIGDAYTKNQTDFLLSGKANWGITLAAYGIGDAYTQTAVNTLLAAKQTQIDNLQTNKQ
ncbi:gp53-like domain-containing protein, partial [Pseudomonas helleri]